MSEKQKILIVDDDNNIAELMELYLVKEFFDTKIVNDGVDAISAYNEFKPDLVLLDLMLPGIDGYEVCKRIRKDDNTPIIITSAKGETFDKVLALELGADDYIMKPFDSKEMVARVKAVLRRTAQSASQVQTQTMNENDENSVNYTGLYLSLTNYTCLYNNQTVALPPKEFELLYYLASHPNQVFTRDQLLEKVWGYEYIGDTRTVDVHVKRIREKIKDGDDWAISTVWGVGYKFETGVRAGKR